MKNLLLGGWLCGSPGDEKAPGNHRNGYSRMRVLTGDGALELEIPQDGKVEFEPQLIRKYRRRFPALDEKITARCARGMTTRDIQAHVEELYAIEVSA